LSYWDRKDVSLRLSSAGQEALSGIFEGEFIAVFVQWSDEHGLWVLRDERSDGTITVVLIAWDCFLTAMLDVGTTPSVVQGPLGFK
jgi:hypothetical protein